MLGTTNIVVPFYIQIFEPVACEMDINGKKNVCCLWGFFHVLIQSLLVLVIWPYTYELSKILLDGEVILMDSE